MSNFIVSSLEPEILPAIRANKLMSSTFMKEKSKKYTANGTNRHGSLSPLHLTHKALDDIEFNGLCIGLMKLQSRGNTVPQDVPTKLSSTTKEFNFLEKHYNFTEHKRLSKLDFSKIKRATRSGERYPEKYAVISKATRFAGRSPEKINLMKGATIGKLMSRAGEKTTRLRINGVMKTFSPRNSANALNGALITFKK